MNNYASFTNQQIVSQIEGYAKTLTQSLRVLDERRHILEPLIYNKDIKSALDSKFNNTYGAHAYNHLPPLLAQDIIRDISRLFLDDDKRSGSFVNLYRKAKDPKINKSLKHKFSTIPDKMHNNAPPVKGVSEEFSKRIFEGFREQDRNEFEQSFIDGWNKVEDAINELEKDHIAIKIKTFRDKYHAHLEMTPLGKDPSPFDVSSLDLTYNDILYFHDKYIDSIFELIRIITGGVHDLEGFSKAHSKTATDFWCILAGIENNAEA